MFSTSLSSVFSTSSLTRSMPILASLFLRHSLFIRRGLSVSAMACSSSDFVSFRRPFSLNKIVSWNIYRGKKSICIWETLWPVTKAHVRNSAWARTLLTRPLEIINTILARIFHFNALTVEDAILDCRSLYHFIPRTRFYCTALALQGDGSDYPISRTVICNPKWPPSEWWYELGTHEKYPLNLCSYLQ